MEVDFSDTASVAAAMNAMCAETAAVRGMVGSLTFVLGMAIGVGDNPGMIPTTLSARIIATLDAMEAAGLTSPIFDTLRAAIAGAVVSPDPDSDTKTLDAVLSTVLARASNDPTSLLRACSAT